MMFSKSCEERFFIAGRGVVRSCWTSGRQEQDTEEEVAICVEEAEEDEVRQGKDQNQCLKIYWSEQQFILEVDQPHKLRVPEA